MKSAREGFFAKKVSLYKGTKELRYELPRGVKVSRNSKIDGWETIKDSNWTVVASSRYNVDEEFSKIT